MIYLKTGGAEPFVIVCDGEYEAQIAYHRLNRMPCSFMAVDQVGRDHPHQEITLFQFLRLHNMAPA